MTGRGDKTPDGLVAQEHACVGFFTVHVAWNRRLAGRQRAPFVPVVSGHHGRGVRDYTGVWWNGASLWPAMRAEPYKKGLFVYVTSSRSPGRTAAAVE